MKNSSKTFFITKMQGAGNSFLITSEIVDVKSRAHISKNLCNINFGIGADGMVFLNFKKDENFEWDFYNSDGSEAAFCGNAARCVGLYIFNKYPDEKKMAIKTRVGIVKCELKSEHTVQVEMPDVEWLSKSLVVPFWPTPVAWLDTGVPHLVLEVSSLEDLKKYKSEATRLRSWNQLGPAGANITFIFQHSKAVISAVTFERGVEDFTMACGTGAVAAASFIMEKNNTLQCQVKMPGGLLDIVLLNGKIFMTGEAYKIADASVFLSKDLK